MNKITYLRIGYWWGAIVDALLGIEMFFSAFLGSLSPFLGVGMTINGDESYRYAISIAATFMLVWTFILLWADRKPVDRKGILVLLIPVIIGMRISMLLGYLNNVIPSASFLIDSILSIPYLVFIIFTLTYTMNLK